ncbi:hypothetical protein [Umboniibacter marinipuniceus]|uniref:TM2 domain-containing protein n=1 Tax=Umboniibacter marinipuniceus TaxID=569599 RepID=A0A3M0A7Q4_9GAMM|nr:hypothetical protein [Umboniibacter marinipuniceus]RMA78838.1 hypothetical protein DFR27_2177 [Umboniibacter marinipuniceus]
MLTEALLFDEEQKLERKLAELTEAQRSFVETAASEVVRDPQEFTKRQVLFFFGWHHFYANNWLRGSLLLALFLYLPFAYIDGVLWPIALLLLVWATEIPLMINGRRYIRDRNATALRSALGKLKKR